MSRQHDVRNAIVLLRAVPQARPTDASSLFFSLCESEVIGGLLCQGVGPFETHFVAPVRS